ncbi:MAG: Fe-S cluster assembly ATPase SufC [Kordiimonadaceae bacterium]|jgi:Fe-S cluster assembly ATP-binding protein|nr:Fe-S cluster assembly ATPase SufC [Kordiimonadaceae bacterium]MDB4219075.1 Fe-S cluster assembly ATPase SufC [Emcibacteraceae bacterium]MBT6134595.1 Fe-S cluster assembly ATPase SufC [Kordiimonadaceae bacterium]MBT6466654.1 Fe-S cluster assembly ATPase SufC [Kordiimonadaceae bacterium]MBT7605108.1 Fe-S cluster assembly ATPase SufC [Kordiimonadaceae bacterium]|tara:strand:+ start:8458 stop:9213 length:756 start_codon:yes stop_codon:yes gene_type:complete
MLEIKNLHVEVGGQKILKGLNLNINDGEVHAIMGPNGAGKSTLSYAICGKPGYEITEGSVTFKGKNFLELEASERAGEGVFLGFQYPVEIPGVSNINFLRAAINSVRKYRNEGELAAGDFLKLIRSKAAELEMDPEMLKRAVNVGFSGGEKKRNEMVQMSMLDPIFAVLDETDSGLDIDALRIVADGINRMRCPEKSILVITHYQRLLDYVVPDFVHVLANGKIVKSGDKSLAIRLEKEGYAGLGIEENVA